MFLYIHTYHIIIILHRNFIFFQTYVQDLLKEDAKNVYQQLVVERGHFYVCGDCTMAEHVFKTLRQIIQEEGKMTEQDVDNYMLNMRVTTFY